jgi:serine protease
VRVIALVRVAGVLHHPGEQIVKHHPKLARLAGAGVTLLVAAACSDVSRSLTAPARISADESPSLSVSPSHFEVLHGAAIHGTVGNVHAAHAARPTRSKELYYHGGVGGIGIESAPKVYLVLYGSQWSNDPSGEANILQSFLKGVGGSKWLNSVSQYCEGVASGTTFCNGAGTAAGNPSGIFAGIYVDNGITAPSRPSQTDLANEAIRAAAHFGNTNASSNVSAQYVIATAHGNNASGFGSQYCAYHSSTSSSYGNVAYTNLPYMTDGGASCGANFNGLGPNAGITIVEGHELAETITDQFPNGGWLDGSGAENGDKCAWISSGQGATAAVSFSTGTFPVQSLWSNAFNTNRGGCVQSY